jgi:hypothetical protein
MPYDGLTTGEIAAGEAVKQELFSKLKVITDDQEDRIADLEAGLVSFDPMEFNLIGPYSGYGASQTDVLFDRVTFAKTLTAARLLIWQAGTSGTTQVDLLYKRGGGAWTSIFQTQPSVVYSAGDGAVSTNAVFLAGASTFDLLSGDLLKLNITSVQALGKGATLQLEFEKT